MRKKSLNEIVIQNFYCGWSLATPSFTTADFKPSQKSIPLPRTEECTSLQLSSRLLMQFFKHNLRNEIVRNEQGCTVHEKHALVWCLMACFSVQSVLFLEQSVLDSLYGHLLYLQVFSHFRRTLILVGNFLSEPQSNFDFLSPFLSESLSLFTTNIKSRVTRKVQRLTRLLIWTVQPEKFSQEKTSFWASNKPLWSLLLNLKHNFLNSYNEY